MNYSGTKGGSGTVKADGNGDYIITLPIGWSGTITPSKGDYHFNPPNLSFPNVYSDQTDQNFEAY